jgi:hypothetical protein
MLQMASTTSDEDLLADVVLTLHADTTDLSTIDSAIIASCSNPPPPPSGPRPSSTPPYKSPNVYVYEQEIPVYMENVKALATVSIDPNLNLQLDQSPTSLSKLDLEHPGAIRSSSFKTVANTNQFKSETQIEPKLVLITMQLITPSMPKPHTTTTFITGYEPGGCRNPNYIYRLLAQSKHQLLTTTPFLIDFAQGAQIKIENCEIGYLVHDRRSRNNLLNRYTRFMKAAAWERQPSPKIVLQEDDQHMCYFHILFYLTFVPLIPKQPKMVNRGTITENTENSSQILDIHHRLAEKTAAKILRFSQQNYPLIKPSNPNPFRKRPSSPMSPPPGKVSRTHN